MGGSCEVVKGLPVPIQTVEFSQWTDFSFTSPIAITPNSNLFLYVLVQNVYADTSNGYSATGLRIEFFDTSTFY